MRRGWGALPSRPQKGRAPDPVVVDWGLGWFTSSFLYQGSGPQIFLCKESRSLHFLQSFALQKPLPNDFPTPSHRIFL